MKTQLTVDPIHGIVLPEEMRKATGLVPGQTLSVSIFPGEIRLKSENIRTKIVRKRQTEIALWRGNSKNFRGRSRPNGEGFRPVIYLITSVLVPPLADVHPNHAACISWISDSHAFISSHAWRH